MSTHLDKSDPGRLAFRFSTLGATLQAAQDFAVESDVQFGRLTEARFREGEGATLVVPEGSWVPGARFIVLAERTPSGATVLVAAPDAERDHYLGTVIGGFAVGADNYPDPASAWDIAPRPRPAPRSPTEAAPEGGAPAMRHTAQHPVPPVAEIAAMPIPERMCEVIRRNRLEGQPTTLSDFHQAEETCDLSDAELEANIGHARRLMRPELVRIDQPPTPMHPWDDPGYRKERIEEGRAAVAEALRRRHYTPAEVKALGPAITAAAFATLAPEAA